MWKSLASNYYRSGYEHTFFRNALRRNLFLFDQVFKKFTELNYKVPAVRIYKLYIYGYTGDAGPSGQISAK